jgi:hypothetical protein
VTVGVGALLLLLGAAALRIDPLPVPALIAGEIVAQGDAVGVPCEVAVWQGAIRPLEGRGEPLAVGRARTGGPFVAEMSRTPGHRRRPGWLWISVQCDGYHVRVYAFEWRWLSEWLHPALELGRVFVPKTRGVPPEETRPAR